MSHFENLWEEAENVLKEDSNSSSHQQLIKEAMGKLSALEALTNLKEMPQNDLNRLKANAMGKLLLIITQISCKDSINVYAALRAAIDDKKIDLFEIKYK